MYGLYWPGKEESKQEALTQTDLSFSSQFSLDDNVFITGDNLDALKLLQETHTSKVKMIYIDPPYNTGKNKGYKDNFHIPKRTWMKDYPNLTLEGRFHTKWLNMMYPRLYLARNLLRDDGVIFISIDDHEMANLRKLCDEVFGEENFVENFMWRSRLGKGATSKKTATLHEYILTYAKNIEHLTIKGDIRTQLNQQKERIRQWGQGDKREDRPTMFYPVKSKESGIVFPIKSDGTEGRWRISKEKFEKMQADGFVVFEKQSDGRIEAYRIIPEGTITETAQDSILNSELVKTTAHGSKEITSLFGIKIFDYPKPSNLVSHFIKLTTEKSDIVLDFFAGSATTAHAVLDLNKQDGGNRKFILVQLPEPCAPESEAAKAGYKTIADIGKERIRRVIKKLEVDASFKDIELV